MPAMNEPSAGKTGGPPLSSETGQGRKPETRIAPSDGKSHVVGDLSEDLRHSTIPDLLAEIVSKHGHRDAAVFLETGQRLSYSEFARDVDEMASGLLSLGLEPGDRVGVWLPNRYEWLLTQFATARAGLILVNINPAYRLSELEFAINKVGCKALVIARSFKSSDYVGMIRELAPELGGCEPGRLEAERLPTLKTVICVEGEKIPGTFGFEEVKAKGGQAPRPRLDEVTKALAPDDPINIQFTSGTTGSPKGATLTHFNIVNNAHFVTKAIRFTEEDRLCIPVPLYHCFGMVMGTLGCVTKGACMVFPGEGFDPVKTLRAIHQERCTAMYGVPTMFVTMLDSPDFREYDMSSLRTGIMAGGPCPIEIMKRVVAEMHMREVTIAYGMTETSPVSFQSSTDDPVEKRICTVGRIQPHVEVKIVDENQSPVAPGQRGELWTRGYSVMKGYWGEEGLTQKAITEDGWMRTGDLAVLDEDGYCSIVGRIKDMIIRGGENIYPREIEEFLHRHPKVQSAQVFGIPSEKYGEEVCAWMVLRPGAEATAEEMRSFCEGQIAHYKIPARYRFLDELPMTVTGKPQKFVMREKMMEELGLKDIATA